MGHDSQSKGTRLAGVLDRRALAVIMQILPISLRVGNIIQKLEVTQSVS